MCKKLLSISIILLLFIAIFTTISCTGEFSIKNIKSANNTAALDNSEERESESGSGSGSGSESGSEPENPIDETLLPYLSFSSPNAFSIKVNDGAKRWNGTLEYSTNPTNETSWTEWVGTEINSALNGEKNILYLRGSNNTIIVGNNANSYWVITSDTNTVECKGDIRTLLNYENPEESSMGTRCFQKLFNHCEALTTAPALPATTLSDSCYSNMFAYCYHLTTAPELPATSLAPSCYTQMFSDCYALTTAPELPATTLAASCYKSMFYKCKVLTTAPSILPAETLTEACYRQMFSDCEALTTAPAISATTLANECCSQMFYNCIALTTVPALLATTLANSCYYQMFKSCSNLSFYNSSGAGHTDYIEIGGTGGNNYSCKEMLSGTTGYYSDCSENEEYLGKRIYTSNQIMR